MVPNRRSDPLEMLAARSTTAKPKASSLEDDNNHSVQNYISLLTNATSIQQKRENELIFHF